MKTKFNVGDSVLFVISDNENEIPKMGEINKIIIEDNGCIYSIYERLIAKIFDIRENRVFSSIADYLIYFINEFKVKE